MKDTAVIAIGAFLAIAVIMVAAVVMGHDGALITGSIATIAGISGSITAYKSAQAKFPKWHAAQEKKEESETKGENGQQ